MLFSLWAYSQQGTMNLTGLFHDIHSNPALAGSQKTLVGNISFRNDWLLDDNHPQTLILSGHTPLKKEQWGIGAIVFNDRFGTSNQSGILGVLSYTIKTSKGDLSFGIKSGFQNFKIDETSLLTISPNDPILIHSENKFGIDLGLGLHLQNERYYVGISIPETINRTSNKLISSFSKTSWDKKFSTGANIDLSQNINLSLHFIARKYGALPTQVQITPLLTYKKKLDFGLIIRDKHTLGGIVSFWITEKINLAYAYDKTNNLAVPKSLGNHELNFSYVLKQRVKTFSPKFF